jgi:hypothetical protein
VNMGRLIDFPLLAKIAARQGKVPSSDLRRCNVKAVYVECGTPVPLLRLKRAAELSAAT